MFHKKEFLIAFSAMMIFAVYAVYYSIDANSPGFGWADYGIPAAEYMTAMYVMSRPGQALIYMFAFMIVLPYSMSYMAEFETGELTMILTRTSRTKYCISKVITCFIGNVIIVLVPLLINYLFCKLMYPSRPNSGYIGEYGLINYTGFILGQRSMFIQKYGVIPMASLFVNKLWLYTIVHIVLMALAGGALGAFLVCLSFVIRSYRAILFLPVFLLVRLSASLNQYLIQIAINNLNFEYVNFNFMNYFQIGDSRSLSPYYLPIFFGVIIVFCAVVIFAMSRTDRLLLGEVKSIGKAGKKKSA